MTDHQIKQSVNAYFEVLNTEGIPEKYVRDFKCNDGQLVVTILTGKTYSKPVKKDYESTPGNVRGGLVSGIGGAFEEPSIQRDWAEATIDGEAGQRDDSKVLRDI